MYEKVGMDGWRLRCGYNLRRLRANDPGLTKLCIKSMQDDEYYEYQTCGARCSEEQCQDMASATAVGPESATAIASTLGANSSLASLELALQYVDNAGAAALGMGLQGNSTLHTLIIHPYNNHTGFGDAGAAPIFANGTHLRKLDLSGNHLGMVPASVCGMMRLEELYLQHNNIASVSAGIVALEGTLRELNLSGNPIYNLTAQSDVHLGRDEVFRHAARLAAEGDDAVLRAENISRAAASKQQHQKAKKKVRLAASGVRAQLSWAAQPRDLDLHVVWNGASGPEHIYGSNKKSRDGSAEHDVSVSHGFGPETVSFQGDCARCIYTCYGEQWHVPRSCGARPNLLRCDRL
jgi:hypothetical protein